MTKFSASRARTRSAQAFCVRACVVIALAMFGCDDSDARDHDPAANGDAALRDAAPSNPSPLDASLLVDASIDATPAQRDGSRDAASGSDGAPRLSEIVDSYFTGSCNLGRCHTTLSPQGELSLTGRGTRVYDALVNVRSVAVPSRIRVVPFHPEASYLMEKLESEMPAAGTRMPPSSVPELEQIARVRAWILAGARND